MFLRAEKWVAVQYYGLDDKFQLNIEPNHTTLAGHDYEHDLLVASKYGMLGSVDCNSGDPMVDSRSI